MPFDPSTDPIADPTIRIFFGGLLMITPTPESNFKRADVFVVEDHSTDHGLSVDVSVDEPQPTFPFLRLGNKVLRHELRISKGTPQGIKKFAGTSQPGVDPVPPDLDFKRLHPRASVKPAAQHRAAVKITDGLLHAAKRRTSNTWLERGGVCTPCTAALVLGIRLEASLQDEVTLTWRDGSLVLPRPEDPIGTKYLILVDNSRPVPADVNDFKHLYHALDGVPTAEEFNLAFEQCPSEGIGILTTPRIPCIPGTTDG